MADSRNAHTPSAKVAGKRPALNNDPDPAASHTTPSSRPGIQTRQKRVLPSRSRRGGPGVGSCDVDLMILETRKRRFESEPLIPPSTKFLLTTKSSLVPPSQQGTSSTFTLNEHAYGRYFERPEVQQACRQQANIQTPEFTQLPDDAIVGGRFRPRGSEEEAADTSDAAYEKRHRKYETFEKRQRLREKEKLKHEQYKLKERIEQLRAMDTSAFLALPASQFSEPPGVAHVMEYDETDTGISELPGAHVNGAAAYNEGERRRQEMLEIAQTLEERYRVLLPPDRKWQEKKEKAERAKRESLSVSYSMEHEAEHEPDAEPEPGVEPSEEEDELPTEDQSQTLAPEPETESRGVSDGESEVDFEARDRERSKKLKLRIKFPPRPATAIASSSPSKKIKSKAVIQTKLPFLSLSAPVDPILKRGPTKLNTRGSNGRFVSKDTSDNGIAESISAGPPRKRVRASSVSTTYSTAPSRYSHSGASRVPCALMIAAQRNATAPSARKTNRHITAFGVRVPQELEEIRDYELPVWFFSDDDDDEAGAYDDEYDRGQYDTVSQSILDDEFHPTSDDVPRNSVVADDAEQ